MQGLVLLMIAAAVFMPAAIQAQPVATAWVQPTRGVSVALDAANNVYTVDYEQALGAEMTLTKRDSGGNLLWVKFYGQTSTTTWERASWVTTDPMENAIICGTMMSGYSNPVEAASIVVKFDPSGNVLWRQVYESSFDDSSVRKCLADGNGNIYVLGMGTGPNGRVTKVKKFTPGSTALWPYFEAGGNTYVVHGEYVSTNAGTVVKKIGPTGTLLWEHAYPSSGFRVEVGTDSRPIVSGFPNSGTAGAPFFKTDSNGTLQWANLDADGPLGLLAHAHMLLDGDNNAYLAAGTMSDMAVCKVSSDGSNGWTQTVSFGYAYAIALSRTGTASVFVVGGTTARLNQGGNPPAPPAPPTGLVASAVTSSSALLSWTDSASSETGFALERCTGSLMTCASNAGWSVRATLAADVTSFSDTGLAPQTAYSWRVKAFNSLGASSYSNDVSATTLPAPPPAAPSNLAGQSVRAGGRMQVSLTWTDNANNETGFRVERCTGGGCTSFASIASPAANAAAYVDTAVTRRTTYRYRLAAVGSGGVLSAYSNIVTVPVSMP